MSAGVLMLVMAGIGTDPALSAEPLAPPAIYPAGTWQGKSDAVLRVLNRLDTHVETIHVPAGSSAHYQTLNISVARCLESAPTLRTDAAAWIDVQDTHMQGAGFHGWMLAAEPSLGVFENPLYDIRVVGCAGNDIPPVLSQPEHPPVPALPGAKTEPGSNPGTSGNDATPLAPVSPDSVSPESASPVVPDDSGAQPAPQ
ncbi:DUF2155 domain-containing protein [Acetobacter sp. LMG 1636]|uniref:DUF2155 domain-containing protein n=2 Tax=Acetobacter fallax TaxID=1737473 RepID=A0ABX0K9N4_9PROT|nr:DUF2155 domain-containing protein [Acetobacter fallax]NHO35576.1 DUF2155 domain-containing protein [Acetobacter fallax]